MAPLSTSLLTIITKDVKGKKIRSHLNDFYSLDEMSEINKYILSTSSKSEGQMQISG